MTASRLDRGFIHSQLHPYSTDPIHRPEIESSSDTHLQEAVLGHSTSSSHLHSPTTRARLSPSESLLSATSHRANVLLSRQVVDISTMFSGSVRTLPQSSCCHNSLQSHQEISPLTSNVHVLVRVIDSIPRSFICILLTIFQKKPFSAVSVQIDRMTSEQYDEEDMSGIIDLIEVIRIQSSGPTEAARAIRKKL